MAQRRFVSSRELGNLAINEGNAGEFCVTRYIVAIRRATAVKDA
jgi:hypothetical protein